MTPSEKKNLRGKPGLTFFSKIALSSCIFLVTGAHLACSNATQPKTPEVNKDEQIPLLPVSIQTQFETQSQNQTILVTGLDDEARLRSQARAKGLKIEGEAVLQIEGPCAIMSQLKVASSESPQVILDGPIEIDRPDMFATPEAELLYLAAEDFGIPNYRKRHPEVDGRGAIIGIVDDGISFFHSGLAKTSEGKRKILSFKSASPELNLILTDEDAVTNTPRFLQSNRLNRAQHTKVWFGELVEPDLISDGSISDNAAATYADWNENGIKDRYAVAVGSLRNGGFEICVDLNVNQEEDDGECVGDFAQTGEFSFWAPGSKRNLAGIFDPETLRLSLSEGESPGDGHGEGVASVAAGHQIGGSFDGVAPGSQILDYDLSARSGQTEAAVYSIGTFLRALEWLGQQGADVANISYSLFFQSVDGQLFMQKAISEIVAKHNMVIAMSAGNNGPGLASLNRRAIYPEDVLVAGAFVGPKLYESVHGVTGLPSQGRVVSYSSRGPGPFGGMGPTVISPLASLTHAPPGEGYRAFSGTSSASPALAGLAANLISAIHQAGLPVQADLVVQAIRLSGKPLRNVPFLEQGHGLPKIETAVKLYGELIRQTIPSRIEVRFPAGPVAESGFARPKEPIVDPSKQAKGLFFRTSGIQKIEQYSFEATLKGFYSNLPQGADHEIKEPLSPLKIVSTAEWVNAPANSFVSEGQSRITLTIDFAKAMAEMDSNSELFAEVHLLDTRSSIRLATIPVTFINDIPLSGEQHFKATLKTEQSKRIHIYVQPGTQALELTPKITRGTGDQLLISVFDNRGVQISSRFRRPQGTTIVPVNQSGWHQVVLTKYRGGEETLGASVAIQPLQLQLGGYNEQPIFELETGRFTIQNNHPADVFEGALEFRSARELVKRDVQTLSLSGSVRFDFSLRGIERDVEFDVSSLSAGSWNYFELGHSCIWDLRDASDNQLARIAGSSGFILDLSPFQLVQNPTGEIPAPSDNGPFQHLVRQISIRCWIFEDTGSTTLQDSRLALEARVGLVSDTLIEGWSDRAGQIPIRLVPGQNTVMIPELLREHLAKSSLTALEVRLRSKDELPSEGFHLGKLEIH